MSQPSFDDRLNRVSRKHRNLTSGMVYRLGPDGLISAEPDRRATVRFPLRPLLFIAGVAFVFKVVLFVGLGEGTYMARLSHLQEGRVVERAAAWAMQPDPATRALADLVKQLRPT
ncbi:MAG: hypothetical protein AVDCRST_MAG15-1465 [uncultured Rubellimicrobium sp.]|uniref:Uncharacterized protein n=1 Tax=uncultured Rubellimicrobium sp. TaxID=543078 RepID=A0A6J4P8A7_9RHOB|nr:MAG: hypothetical protein AVDCRST_MAG15-1465 [uncultured Rubellimicrobium sp.]